VGVISSAAWLSFVGWVVEGAPLEHLLVWSDRVVVRQLHLILAKELAVWKVGVVGDALLGERSSRIEQVHDVDVHRGELSRLNGHVVEQATCLVHGGHVGRADPVATVSWFEASVLPAVHLSHGHHIFDTHVLLGGKLSDFTDVFTVNTKTLVKSRREEVVGKGRFDVFNKLEHHRHELSCKKGWPVVVGSIDPTV